MNSSKPTALLASLLASLFTAGLATAADSTIIPFNLTQNARVSLGVYNKEGAQVRTLLIGEALAKGTHSVVWDEAEARLHTAKAALAWAVSS